MQINTANPVIVQGDGKVHLETRTRASTQARDFLARFAELESSPDLLHTYRITPLSLWNAASVGDDPRARSSAASSGLSKFDIPEVVLRRSTTRSPAWAWSSWRVTPTIRRTFLRVELRDAASSRRCVRSHRQVADELLQGRPPALEDRGGHPRPVQTAPAARELAGRGSRGLH
jgi:hypothetical protein